MPGRTHSREFKLEVCRQIATGEKRPVQICREHNLVDSMLTRWRKEYAQRGENAFAPKQATELSAEEKYEARIAELERHCGQLSLENALLKKWAHHAASKNGTP